MQASIIVTSLETACSQAAFSPVPASLSGAAKLSLTEVSVGAFFVV